MRIPSHANRPAADQSTVLTPLIDVVFLLLLFFLCASTGQIRHQLLDTPLPQGGLGEIQTSVPQSPEGRLWCRIERIDNRTVFQMEGRTIRDRAELSPFLKSVAEYSKTLPVVLDPVGEAPLADVVAIYDACRAAGFQSIHFALENPSFEKLKEDRE